VKKRFTECVQKPAEPVFVRYNFNKKNFIARALPDYITAMC